MRAQESSETVARKPGAAAKAAKVSAQAVAKRPAATDIHVGGRIRLRRKVLGMSQEALGKKVGITFQQIQKYEKGTNRVGASRLQAMAGALDVPVSYFFPDGANDAEPPAAEKALLDYMGTTEGIEICRAVARIPGQRLRRKLLELARAMGEPAF